MGVCPNIKLPEWKRLVAAKGEREAYYLWAKYNGTIPEIEFRDTPIDDGFDSEQDDVLPKTLSDRETSDTVQEMTFLMLNDFIKSDENLFNIEKVNSTELYQKLKVGVLATVRGKEIVINDIINNSEDLTKSQKERLQDIIKSNRKLQEDILADWPRIVARHKEYIRAYSIEFDENDSLQINDEDKIRESNRFDASKIDNFRKANTAIKLLLASNPVVDKSGKSVVSSIGGRLLVSSSKSFITLMNNLHTSRSVEEMIERLRDLAVQDPTYEMLYSRLTRSSINEAGVDFSNIDTAHGIQLLSGLWKTFKKANLDVKNTFIFENGEVAIGSAALSSAALQLKDRYIGTISTLSKAGKGYFNYNKKTRKYTVNRTRLGAVNLQTRDSSLNFLSTLGIPFSAADYNKLTPANKKQFQTTLGGLLKSLNTLSQGKGLSTFSTRTLDMNSRLLEIGILQQAASNPEFSSTYFNLQGERVQVYLGVNAISELHDNLSQIDNLNELAGTKYEYLLKDVFVKGSNLLRRMFTEDGAKKAGANKFLKPGYAGGIDNKIKNKLTPSSRLSARQRFIQELNLNRNGQYLNLVPGDASIEHMLYMGDAIQMSDLNRGMTDINEIFKGYFISELELSRDNRPIPKVEYKTGTPEFKKRKTTDLRFFKNMLGEKLHNEILDTSGTPEEVYKIHQKEIDSAVKEFILTDVGRTNSYLKRFDLLTEVGENYTVDNVEGLTNLNKSQFTNEMILLSVNYTVANIEMHKVIYSDPYQYKDELKRIKSFLSPRQALVSNSPKMNVAYNNIYNKGYSKDDMGYTNFTKDYMSTVTHKDVIGVIDLPNYGEFEETDGGGSIIFKAYRNFRIRTADWNENEEMQYKYEVAWEKRHKKLEDELSEEEKAILKQGNPKVKSAFTPLKPITSGPKLDKDGNPSPYNNVVLDKFSLYPLSYRVMVELGADNGVKLYNKMQSENVDYMVFDSSRKVGAENSHATYNEVDGSFNNTDYKSIVNVPLSIMSLQSDVPSKNISTVTRGSQVTKLITMDFMSNGVPIDYKGDFTQWNLLSQEERETNSKLYKEIVNNQKLLEEMTNEGYLTLLERLGITENNGEFSLSDEGRSKAVETLREEIFKRETNDNISDALEAYLNGEAVLEATPAYQIVRNVLYSAVDRLIVSPKISGSQLVQISSTMFESTRAAITDINGKKGYTSDILSFYEDADGKRVMEVMVGRWFKSDLSDEKLLEYLNTTDEGKKILSGLAFRIPTQAQNSIDAIRIKKFLPEEFGDSVVVPAAIVEKVGSDFDIDKLSIYFKNVFYQNGKLRMVPYFGMGKTAKDEFGKMFDEGKLFDKKQKDALSRLLLDFNSTGRQIEQDGQLAKLLGKLGFSSEKDVIEEFAITLKELGLKDTIVNSLYKKSLENEFIQSSENLVTDELNFKRLTTPNDSTSLEKISEDIVKKITGKTFDYSSVSNLLDRRFMSRLRQAFVSGKQAIGIAARTQTNHSLNQRGVIYVNKNNLKDIALEDQKYLGDGVINFEKYNKVVLDGQEYPSLSGIDNADDKLISNINSQFIDGYVDITGKRGPWIMEMGATPNLTSTYQFLINIGVPADTVAYFMNQPIILNHMQSIENKGYRFIYIDQFIDDTISKYGGLTKKQEDELPNKIPSKASLFSTLGKLPSGATDEVTDDTLTNTLTKEEQIEQIFIFREFLKYAKMADQLRTVMDGTNWDTTNFNDPFLILKKNLQLVKAQDSIISSVDDVLDNSFIRNLSEKINDARDGVANFLVSDTGRVRDVLEQVLTPYANLPDKVFVKLAKKAVNDLFDWSVQTDQNLNKELQDLLLSETGVGSQVISFIDTVKKNKEHPLYQNEIINILEVVSSPAVGNTPTNLKLANRDNKVYDQNNIIYAFRELREYLEGSQSLYDKIVKVAILQSGLGNSPISFTSLIPYKDFSRIYNKTLSRIEKLPNLQDFYNLSVFQRNNWNDSDVAPSTSLNTIPDSRGRYYYPSLSFFGYTNLRNAMKSDQIPQLVSGGRGGEFEVFTWTDLKISATERATMRKDGDYSYLNKGLYKKVYDADKITPLTTEDSRGRLYFIYKPINALGDSFRANEFYPNARESIIDNGMMKVKNEVIDEEIVSYIVKSKTIKSYDKVETGDLIITVKGDRVTVNNRSFSGSMINYETLTGKLGYTPEQAGEIINAKCKG